MCLYRRNINTDGILSHQGIRFRVKIYNYLQTFFPFNNYSLAAKTKSSV